MLVNYLITQYKKLIDRGWGAFEMGNTEQAEKLFRAVLEHEDDPHMHAYEAVEAHNGMASVSMRHKDLFDTARWYMEAKYLLDDHYHQNWPKELDWNHPYERAAMRTLMGLGHVEYLNADEIAYRYPWLAPKVTSGKFDPAGRLDGF